MLVLISTTQAAKILGVKAGGTVVKLINRGILKDYKEKKPGSSKHFHLLDANEVQQYALKVKEVGINKHQAKLDLKAARVERKIKRINGLGTDNTIPKVGSIPVPGIVQRLDRIETKLDQLIEAFK